MKNSYDTMGNRTSDLPARNAVPPKTLVLRSDGKQPCTRDDVDRNEAHAQITALFNLLDPELFF